MAVQDDEQITPSVWGTIPGGSITFTCNAAEDIRWFNKTLRTDDERTEYHSRLYTINVITVKDTGYYYCYGRYYRRNRHFLARAKLKVYGMSVSKVCV